MRGKPGVRRGHASHIGITPARAGKTQPARDRQQRIPDHPRACGENLTNFCSTMEENGSPPRVRGKQLPRSKRTHWIGITPARAGKTPHQAPWRSGTPDHPRACGENAYSCASAAPTLGSPPRVRGKLIRTIILARLLRITPARAGKTAAPVRGTTAERDHPRACGENLTNSASVTRWLGSPPRVRGKPPSLGKAVNDAGITPARAGKTSCVERSASVRRDHPRACGENSFVRFPMIMVWGSPPRVRGKH